MENKLLLLAIWLTLVAMWMEHSPFAQRARKYADNNRWEALIIFLLALAGIYLNG